MLGLAGVERRDGMVGGGGIALAGVRVTLNGLNGFSRPSLLLFFDGEQSVAGSMFSLSASSKSAGSKGRLTAESVGLERNGEDLPLTAGFCASKPILVSTSSCRRNDTEHSYHSDGSLHSRGAVDEGCRGGQMAPSPWARVLPSCLTRPERLECTCTAAVLQTEPRRLDISRLCRLAELLFSL